MYNDVEWWVDEITDELMKVVERECRKARNEGYHDCELDYSPYYDSPYYDSPYYDSPYYGSTPYYDFPY